MTTKNHIEYIFVKEVHDIFTAKLNALGIIEIYFSANNIQIEKEHLILLKASIFEMGNGKKMPVFFNASDFLGISGEARKYAASLEGGEYTLANAVLIKSLASKLLFNFFMNINKPILPTKGFNSKQEAFDWLINLNNSYSK